MAESEGNRPFFQILLIFPIVTPLFPSRRLRRLVQINVSQRLADARAQHRSRTQNPNLARPGTNTVCPPRHQLCQLHLMHDRNTKIQWLPIAPSLGHGLPACSPLGSLLRPFRLTIRALNFGCMRHPQSSCEAQRDQGQAHAPQALHITVSPLPA